MIEVPKEDQQSIVISHSGGLDSTCLLLSYLSKGHKIHCLSFTYGQRHSKEVRCASWVRHLLCVEHSLELEHIRTVDVASTDTLFGGATLLTDASQVVPHGHYMEESMKKTVVPNRNAVFLNLMAAYAIGAGIRNLGIGAHSGDHAIYPDCREEFFAAMERAINCGNYREISICRPFVNMTKGQVLEVGLSSCEELGLDWKEVFGRTWTCYEGRRNSCGRCGACMERLEAFEVVGKEDPLEYSTS